MSRPVEQLYRDLAAVMAAVFPERHSSCVVGPETRVLADLGLSSIELVVLGERLEQYYGRKLPYGQFLAGLRARGAEDLTLDELVKFLQRHA